MFFSSNTLVKFEVAARKTAEHEEISCEWKPSEGRVHHWGSLIFILFFVFTEVAAFNLFYQLIFWILEECASNSSVVETQFTGTCTFPLISFFKSLSAGKFRLMLHLITHTFFPWQIKMFGIRVSVLGCNVCFCQWCCWSQLLLWHK